MSYMEQRDMEKILKEAKLRENARLRDEFAKAAITGILSGKWGQMPQFTPEQAFADFAYRVADEMMKRREQNHGY